MHYALCVMQDYVPTLTFKFLYLLFEVFYSQYSISDALIFRILENWTNNKMRNINLCASKNKENEVIISEGM